jgi:hypothetical protein
MRKVDWDYFATDSWRGDVERTVEALGTRNNREERRHFIAALTNSAPEDRPDEVERHRFFDVLERVRTDHLDLIAVLVRANENPVGGTADEFLVGSLPDRDLENIKLDWQDLQQMGILNQRPSGVNQTPIDVLMAHALPAIGRRFATFVEAESLNEDEPEPEPEPD